MATMSVNGITSQMIHNTLQVSKIRTFL